MYEYLTVHLGSRKLFTWATVNRPEAIPQMFIYTYCTVRWNSYIFHHAFLL